MLSFTDERRGRFRALPAPEPSRREPAEKEPRRPEGRPWPVRYAEDRLRRWIFGGFRE